MAQLFHFPLDPFCRRIRLALGEYGSTVELIEYRPWEPDEALLVINRSGALPIFVDDNDGLAAGVEAVGEYLEETRNGTNAPDITLYGSSPSERAETRRLIAWFDTNFHREVTLPLLSEKLVRRFLTKEQGGGAPNMNRVRTALSHIRPHLEYIGELADERNWLVGNHLSAADLAAAAHLSVIDYMGDVPWSENEAAKIWYQRIKSRPSFRPLLADFLRGMPPPRLYTDLDF